MSIPRRTPEEIKSLARDLVTNRIFLSNDPEEIKLSFGVVLAFLKPDMIDFNEVAAVFEYYSEAGPMSINGLPSFFSLQVIHTEDWPAFRAEAKRMMDALGIEPEETHTHDWQNDDVSDLDHCSGCGETRVPAVAVEESDELPLEVIKWLEGDL
jgi:hypothetical protein